MAKSGRAGPGDPLIRTGIDSTRPRPVPAPFDSPFGCTVPLFKKLPAFLTF